MQKLAEICIQRPVFAWVLMLVLLVVGVVGFQRLGVDRFPNIDFPTVSVATISPGSSAEAVETEITNVIEDSVNTISGIDEVNSVSSEGNSQVRITFDLGKNVDVAAQEVRDKINRILRDLPEGIDQPIITTFDPSSNPILILALSTADIAGGSTEAALREMTEYADKILSEQIESAGGVGEVTVVGGRERQINIVIDPYRLRSYGLTTNDVIRALQAQNAEIPGGQVDQGARSLTLRTEGRIRSVSDFNRVTLRSDENGGIVRLQNVARVEDSTPEVTSESELNGNPTVQISIRKQSGTNSLEVIENIKERLHVIEKTLPAGYELATVRDDSSYIEAAVHAVEEHLILGSILATIVVFIFLMSWRGTFIAAISIPISIIATFGVIWIFGFTLNLITLLALTLAVGIVIDDAIVVLENIHRLMEEQGLSSFEAARQGTQQIGLAVLATTLSLVAVFLPVAFMSGITGRFMSQFGLTMSAAIIISMIVSFALTPMMSARMLKHSVSGGGAKGGHGTGGAANGVDSHKPSGHSSHDSHKTGGFFGVIDRTYTAMLKWSMGHRWVVVLLCAGALSTIMPLYNTIPKNFNPRDDESQVNISFTAPEGTSLQNTHGIARRMDEEIRRMPGVEYTLLTAGESNNLNEASILVRMKPIEKRTITQDELVDKIRKEVMPHFKSANLRSIVSSPSGGFGGGGRGRANVQYVISGPSLQKLAEVSEKTVAELKKVPGIVDPDTSLDIGKPELRVRVDRDMASQLGVSPADVATALRYFVGGDEVTNYNEGSEQYEVHLRAAKEYRTGPGGIGLLTVPSSTLGAVPLGQVVRFAPGTGPAKIEHYNGRPRVTISANLQPGASQAAAVAELQRIVGTMNLGPEYSATASGQAREQARSMAAFLAALMMSFVFMYLILAAQFESWIHPVTILISLPLTVPFALLSLILFGQSLNNFSMLGILVLFGIVKKNSILQIDHTNQLRESGMNRYDAIIQANRDRLRPILMTTLAFVAGMIPLLLSSGTGSGTNRAIGSVIFGGQTLSLLLTLLATPVAYSLFDDASGWMGQVRTSLADRFGGLSSKRRSRPATE